MIKLFIVLSVLLSNIFVAVYACYLEGKISTYTHLQTSKERKVLFVNHILSGVGLSMPILFLYGFLGLLFRNTKQSEGITSALTKTAHMLYGYTLYSSVAILILSFVTISFLRGIYTKLSNLDYSAKLSFFIEDITSSRTKLYKVLHKILVVIILPAGFPVALGLVKYFAYKYEKKSEIITAS